MSKQYLYRVSILNRKNSHPLEATSYYSGQDQEDQINNKKYVSNTKDNVVWNTIATPSKNDGHQYNHLPQYVKFRSGKKDLIDNARNILWRNVFLRETRDDAQFARLFEVSIPSFMSKEDAIASVQGFAKILVNEGMIVDVSVHSRQKDLTHYSLKDSLIKEDTKEEKQENNLDYTAYFMCTLRKYENGIFVNKNREWNEIKKMQLWRKEWVTILAKAIDASFATPEQKKSWDEKMSIYSEYESIKQNLKSTSSEETKTTKNGFAF